ncbi:competence/damage-inducible protein cinA [Actinocorallia herbida]|uniref:CinA-like protein n=1 Tax=Actinocorallia herbida TaxID=58109 RepID=A0A3N1CQK4_9ACTN|nr:CinA family nicotinamide mononucleotide deamidase-related protein [Actinocorallia herbida]ROO83580.1 competence/damage-inducible protein cinA [Actinocorallia herbida]
MRVELLTVGDELLIGDIVNGNAAWMGEELTRAGVQVVRSTVVGDTLEAIGEAVAAALDRADGLIVTGGLGPTYDDLTRDALALLAGVKLIRDPETEAAIRERSTRYGVRLRASALRMADLPEGSVKLPNPAGTAPGIRMELAGKPVYALPGVPFEMRAIMTETVLPELRGPSAPAVLTLRTAGVWETVLAGRLAPVERMDGVALAYLPDPARVDVRITAESAETLRRAVDKARGLLGQAVYAEGRVTTLGAAVLDLLRERDETVAVAESLTGGLLGAELTTPAGSSAVFRGGVTAYATPLKAALLGVPEDLLAERGAVDPDVAIAMAEGARERLGATRGLAVTGVAGPDPQDGKPVGTVHIGVCGPEGSRSFTPTLTLPSDGSRARSLVREMTVVHALDLLRHEVLRVAMIREWEQDQEDLEGLS